jgi:Tfp pilus assembly protein PilV
MSRARRGITLVEVLIAVGIIVVAFIPLVNLVSSSAVTTVKVGNYAKAAALMAKFLEEVKHIPFASITNTLPS